MTTTEELEQAIKALRNIIGIHDPHPMSDAGTVLSFLRNLKTRQIMPANTPILPRILETPVRDALSLMIFDTGPMARTYRTAGYDIPTKAEDAQAFILHQTLMCALEHGENWAAIYKARYAIVAAKAIANIALANAAKVTKRLDE